MNPLLSFLHPRKRNSMAFATEHAVALVIGAGMRLILRTPMLDSANIQGKGSGIGLDAALAFAASPDIRAVVVADFNEKAAHDAMRKCLTLSKVTGFKASALQVDVGDEESVQQVVDATVQRHGRIDCFVNSAGVSLTFRPLA